MARRGRPPMGPAQDGKRPSRLTHEEELQLASEVAELHYLRNSSMVQIADELSLTRFQVARLLQLARDSGIVTIEIKPQVGIDMGLSEAVADRLGINRAVVPNRAFNYPRADVARTLAAIVSESVAVGSLVGLTWSRTLLATVAELRSIPYCDLVQLAGHISIDSRHSGSVEIVRRAAELSGGAAYPIYAPLLAPDAYVADALRGQSDTAAAIERYDRLDLAVISIGSWQEGGSSIWDFATAAEREVALAAGMVGEISGRLFAADGSIDSSGFADRTIGITLDQLSRVPRVIASSYGADRAIATVAAARAGLFDTLVLDRALALSLLAEERR